mmetsp:Transcript_19928/g.28647  ORF Transcript_19928/g.28647 Transcript_19928/m.28647 type:complete len:231 (-) Transcript_19928:181-873(-)
MCWSPEISLAAALGAWGVCIYLYRRNLNYDRWGAAYLFTFTLTQLIDFTLWIEDGRVGLSSCSTPNYTVSKYIIPLVVLSQHCVQCFYPSNALPKYRSTLAALHILPILGMMYQFNCSHVVDSIHGPSLCWGGVEAEMYQILIHSGIVALVFFVLMPLRVGLLHISILGAVMTTLYVTEGTLTLGSKWCSYCLIYSVFYILDPYWAPLVGGDNFGMGKTVTKKSNLTKAS